MWYFKFMIIMAVPKEYNMIDSMLHFHNKYESNESHERDLPSLLYYVTANYLASCTPFVLYDDFFFETVTYRETVLQTLRNLNGFPIIHGFIDKLDIESLSATEGRVSCINFLVFAVDHETILLKLGFQLTRKVVFVSTMSQYLLKQFLASEAARNIQNLLIISDPVLQRDDYRVKIKSKDINLYTHELHVDGIGSSAASILTAWRNNNLTRDINLFPPKLDGGLNGHRLMVSVYERPPFVMRKKRESADPWDGLEVQLLRLLGQSLNISVIFRDAYASNENVAADEVIDLVYKGVADVGIAGIYVTRRYYEHIYFSISHSQDCASFITLSSTAMPKYRAILGPFQWGVWVCVIFIYLAGIVPIVFSYRLKCNMFESLAEVGTFFWMVFGMFTNLFTFRSDSSWNNIKRSSTRTVIGTYWVFTIIITSAYSSSIISFITIPAYFDVPDTVEDLLEEEYKIGTTDTKEWRTFNESSDEKTNKLFRRIDIVNSSLVGLRKVRHSTKYAFLGSKSFLSYAVRSNFSYKSSKKKSLYHISTQCLAPFMVSFAMKPKSDFLIKFDQQIQRFHENGMIEKIMDDINWEISREKGGKLFVGTSGGLRREAPEDRQLTVDDMQGMFLLLGIGLVFAAVALLHECWVGYQCCDDIKSIRSHRSSVPSIVLTPCSGSIHENESFAGKVSTFCRRALSAAHSASSARDALRRFSH